jgi:ketosteroid isomerase-like protein
MSQENVEIVRRAYAAFNEGGVDAARPFLHPDLVWEDRDELPGASVYRGLDGFGEAVERFYEAWDELSVTAEEISDAADDKVLVEHRWRGRGKGGGTPIDTVVWNVLTLQDGLIVRRQAFGDRTMALEAAGLLG